MSFSARWVCRPHAVGARQRAPSRASGRARPRTASRARARSRSIACGRGSWKASIDALRSRRGSASSPSTSASGGRPPGALADAHRAAAGVEAHADRRARRSMRVVEPAAVGIEVQVVAGRRAAGEQQLGEAGQRRDADHLRASAAPRPGRARAASRRARRPAPAGTRARQRLEQVVVGVDEARQQDVPGQVDRRRRPSCGRAARGPTASIRCAAHEARRRRRSRGRRRPSSPPRQRGPGACGGSRQTFTLLAPVFALGATRCPSGSIIDAAAARIRAQETGCAGHRAAPIVAA